jgi:hypothetical protein
VLAALEQIAATNAAIRQEIVRLENLVERFMRAQRVRF